MPRDRETRALMSARDADLFCGQNVCLVKPRIDHRLDVRPKELQRPRGHIISGRVKFY